MSLPNAQQVLIAAQRSRRRVAVGVSAGVHLATLGAMLVAAPLEESRFETDGRRNAIQLTLSQPSTAALHGSQEPELRTTLEPAEALPQEQPPPDTQLKPAPPSEARISRRNFVMRVPEPEPSRALSPRQTAVTRPPSDVPVATDRVAESSPLPPNAARAETPPHQLTAAQREASRPELVKHPPKSAMEQVRRKSVTTQSVTPPSPAVEIAQLAGTNDRQPPDFQNNPSPAYPAVAVARRLEGTVLLELQVAETGHVQGVKILQSSGHSILDQSAMSAVRNWRGRPARQDGRAVATVESIPIRFRLNGS